MRLVAQRDYETISIPSGCPGSSHTVAFTYLQAQVGWRRGGSQGESQILKIHLRECVRVCVRVKLD